MQSFFLFLQDFRRRELERIVGIHAQCGWLPHAILAEVR